MFDKSLFTYSDQGQVDGTDVWIIDREKHASVAPVFIIHIVLRIQWQGYGAVLASTYDTTWTRAFLCPGRVLNPRNILHTGRCSCRHIQ